MDLGVVCKTYQDVISSVINKTINQTLQTCLEQTTTCVTNQPTTNSQPATTSGTNQPTTNSQPVTTSGPNHPTNSQPITTGGTNQPTTNSKLTMTSGTNQPATLAKEMVGSCPVAALGGVIGLLVVALLGLAIGLTVTCCVLGKRRSQKQQAEWVVYWAYVFPWVCCCFMSVCLFNLQLIFVQAYCIYCPLSVLIISEHLSVSMHAGTILLKGKSSQQFNDNWTTQYTI